MSLPAPATAMRGQRSSVSSPPQHKSLQSGNASATSKDPQIFQHPFHSCISKLKANEPDETWTHGLREVPLEIHTTHVGESSSPSPVGKIEAASKRPTLTEPITSFDLHSVSQLRGFHRPRNGWDHLRTISSVPDNLSSVLWPSSIEQLPFWTEL